MNSIHPKMVRLLLFMFTSPISYQELTTMSSSTCLYVLHKGGASVCIENNMGISFTFLALKRLVKRHTDTSLIEITLHRTTSMCVPTPYTHSIYMYIGVNFFVAKTKIMSKCDIETHQITTKLYFSFPLQNLPLISPSPLPLLSLLVM